MGAEILVIDDDPDQRVPLIEALEAADYSISTATGLEEAVHRIASDGPALIFAAIELSTPAGGAFIATLRGMTTVPLVVLTTHESASILGAALRAGADNYLIRPVDLDLLATWTAAILRRAGHPEAVGTAVTVLDASRNLVLDEAARALRAGDELVPLPPLEFRILRELSLTPGVVVSRQSLRSRLWEQDGRDAPGRALDAPISRLRRRLEIDPQKPELLVTVHGEGYRLDPR